MGNGSFLNNWLVDSFLVCLGCPSDEDAYGVTGGLQTLHTVWKSRFSVNETRRF